MKRLENIRDSEILVDNDFNCRGRDLIPLDCYDLANNIKEHGLIQPISIMELDEATAAATGKKYKLIAGFRRMMAHRILADTDDSPWHNVSCIVIDMMTEADQILFNLSENFERRDLNIVQEARALKKLKDMGLRISDYAGKLHKSISWVQIRFYVLDFPEEVQTEIAAGYIKQNQIKELWLLNRNKGQKAMFEAVKTLKEAEARGTKGTIVDPKRVNVDKKKIRGKLEMLDMQTLIRDSMGNNVITRTLAWAAGEISTRDFYDSIADFAQDQGYAFDKPAEVPETKNLYYA